MSKELNSSQKIKLNMEIAMEWMSKLDCPMISVSVYHFGITIIAKEYSIELSNKILETAEEKGVSFDVARNSDNDFLYYTSEEIGLSIIFTD